MRARGLGVMSEDAGGNAVWGSSGCARVTESAAIAEKACVPEGLVFSAQ